MGKSAGQAPFEDKGLYWRTPKTKQYGNNSFSVYSAVYQLYQSRTFWFDRPLGVYVCIPPVPDSIDLLIGRHAIGFITDAKINSQNFGNPSGELSYSSSLMLDSPYEDLTAKLNLNGINMDDLVPAKTDYVRPTHKRLLEVEIYKIVATFKESRGHE